MIKRSYQRFSSLLLIITLFVSLFSPAVEAAIQQTIANLPAQNQSIFAALSALDPTQMTEADIVRVLDEYGLLDEDGNFSITETLRLDGEEMSLAEVAALLRDEETDLSRQVDVDGYRVSLAELQTMIEIENQLAALTAALQSDFTPTEEHQQNFRSLLDQIETQGIAMSLQSLPLGMQTSVNHAARIQVSFDKTAASATEADQSFTATFTLTDSAGVALSEALAYPVSVQYRTTDGSALAGTHFSGQSGTVTFAEGVTSKQVIIPVTQQDSSVITNSESRWNGDRVFYFQVFEPQDILLYDAPASTAAKAISTQLRLTNTYEWAVISQVYFHPNTQYTNNGSGFGQAEAWQDSHSTGLPTAAMTKQIYLENRTRILLADGIANALKLAYVITLWNSEDYVNRATITWDASLISNSETIYTVSHSRDGSVLSLNLESDSTTLPFDKACPAYQLFDFLLSETGKSHLANTGVFTASFAVPTVNETVTNLGRTMRVSARAKNLYLGYGYDGLREGFYDTVSPQYYNTTSNPHYNACSVSVPNGAHSVCVPDNVYYYPGMTIPVSVTFSEPVRAKDVTLEINGDATAPAEGNAAISKRLTFPYTVQDVDDPTLIIGPLSDVSDINGNTTAANSNLSKPFFDGADGSIVSTRPEDGILRFEADKTALKPGESVTLNVYLSEDAPYQQMYAQGLSYLQAFVNGNKNDPITFTSVIPESDGAIYATATYTPAQLEADTDYVIELMLNGKTIIGHAVSFAAEGIKYVQSDDLNLIVPYTAAADWPSGEPYIIYLSDAGQVELEYSYTNTNNATNPGFAWMSSDPEVAQIETVAATGYGRITPVKAGKVIFSVYATDRASDYAYQESPEITVSSEGKPALNVLDSRRHLYIRQGSEAKVVWTTNVNALNGDDGKISAYDIFLLDGNLSLEEAIAAVAGGSHTGKTFSVSGNEHSSYTFAAADLSQISRGTDPSYTVLLRTKNPKSEVMLHATAYIHILSQPVRVALDPLPAYTLLDNKDLLEISWQLHDVDRVNPGEVVFEISCDGQTVGNTPISGLDGPAYDLRDGVYYGHYTLSPSDYGIETQPRHLKDTYSVSLKAKNGLDESWSYDSFLLNVYDAEALQLLVDGAKQAALDLDNEEAIAARKIGYNGSKLSQDEIQQLRQDTHLKSLISINYGDYSWNVLNDLIAWESSDNQVLSVNYRQGSLYENIELFSYDAYLPKTELMLSGLSDGEATVTATHAQTGMSAELDVRVSTLKNKLFVFQFLPMQTTTLRYTTDTGLERSAVTNSDGSLALYEPDGIASDIQLSSGDPKTTLYLGTLYRANLLSGERDSTKLQLYPINTFRLREAARADIYLKDSSGNPYVGEVTFRGGVYKNGGYCQDAGIRVDNESALTSGAQDHTVVTGLDGHVTVYLDIDQFWSREKGETGASLNLSAGDAFRYIFELRFGQGLSTNYYPVLLFVDGNLNSNEIIRTGDHIVRLENVAASEYGRPFIARQIVDYGLGNSRQESVRSHTGLIGPSNDYPQVSLVTQYLLWGEEPSSLEYSARISDQHSIAPSLQQSSCFAYPFSSMPLVEHTLTLDADTIWLPVGESRSLTSRLYRGETMIQNRALPFKAANIKEEESLAENDDLAAALVTLTSSTSITSAVGTSLGDDPLISSGVNMLMGDGAGGGLFKMLISPTTDPSIFTAMIWAGIGEMDFDTNESGMVLEKGGPSAADKSSVPGASDMLNMARSKYGQSVNQDYAEAKKALAEKKPYGGPGFDIEFSGFYEAQIQRDMKTGEWHIFNLGGGFSAGFSADYTWNYNTFVGPVPVTAYLKIGGKIDISFQAAVRYQQANGLPWKSEITAPMVNDYLTKLRANVYARAFAGIGFDLSVIALKIGLFGQIDLTFQTHFLSRTYLEEPNKRQLNGQNLEITGTIGIEFVAKFLFASYEKVLASVKYGKSFGFNDWDYINAYWADPNTSVAPKTLSAAFYSAMTQELTLLESEPKMESRSYIEEGGRSWNQGVSPRIGIRSLDPVNGVQNLETNSYPYANPLLSDDGSLLLYLSDSGSTDVSETNLRWTQRTGGSYPNGRALDTDSVFVGAGDSSVGLAGDGDFAVAAWVRQNQAIEKEAGERLSDDDITVMTNSSEIMAAVFTEGSWQSSRLTENITPDLAPVVATNGSKAIVAWRAAISNDVYNPTVYMDDTLRFALWDADAKTWKESALLYNGTNGNVMGISAAMLDDGTAAIAYVINTSDAKHAVADEATGALISGQEIVVAIIGNDGTVIKNQRLTTDDYLDENPQMTHVTIGQADRFILGWHSMHSALGKEISDIRLAAFDNQGSPIADFPSSISSVASSSEITINGSFRFTRLAKAIDTIENLAIVWSQQSDPENPSFDGADRDILKAVLFVQTDHGLDISASIDVAEMPERTLLDHFDTYLSDADTNEIKAVLLGTYYAEVQLDDPSTYTVHEVTMGEEDEVVIQNVYLSKPTTHLFTATEKFLNTLRVQGVAVDYGSLLTRAPLSLQFTVKNQGFSRIESIRIDVDGKQQTYADLNLLPNHTTVLTCTYLVGEVIADLDYQLDALFLDGSSDSCDGTILLTYPDIGISSAQIIREQDAQRLVQLVLHNDSDVSLGASHRRVVLGVYRDAAYESPLPLPDAPTGMITISDSAYLQLIDSGAYLQYLTLDVDELIGTAAEIPEAGQWVYLRAWIEEEIDGTFVEIAEYDTGNNLAHVKIDNLYARSGEAVTLNVNQNTYDDGGTDVTEAVIDLRNNRLSQTTTGNLIVSLLDENGHILESQQSFRANAANEGLITLGREAVLSRSFVFGRQGALVQASYSDALLQDDTNAAIDSLQLHGTTLALDDFIYSDTEQAYLRVLSLYMPVGTALLSIVTEDPGARVHIDGTEAPQGQHSLAIERGENAVEIVVTARNGSTQQRYRFLVVGSDVEILPSVLPNSIALDLMTDASAVITVQLGLAADGSETLAKQASFRLDDPSLAELSAAVSASSVTLTGLKVGTTSLWVSFDDAAATSYEIPIEISDSTPRPPSGNYIPPNSGGSSSGSGAGSADSGSASANTIPVGDLNLRVSSQANGERLSITMTSEQRQELLASQDEVIVLDVSGYNAAHENDTLANTVRLSKSDFRALAEAGKALVIVNDEGSVLIDAEAMASLAATAGGIGGSSLDITLKQISSDNLPNSMSKEQREAAEALLAEGALIFDVDVLVSSRSLGAFDGSIEVEILYELKEGQIAEGLTVWYLNDAGELEELPCAYENGRLRFTLPGHFSFYVIGYSQAKADAALAAAATVKPEPDETKTPESQPVDDAIEPIILTIDSSTVTQGEDTLSAPPVAPQIINSRTMLPFRYLIQTLLGGEVNWDDATRTVTAEINGHTFEMTIDEATIVIDGEAIVFDQAPVIVNDYTLVPLRVFEKAVQSIEWDEATRTVTIVP